jgi:predicted nucleic acid-binding Zn ribbon protein
MIKKKENCEYCGEKMESITAKKRFCSEKCRVYASRLKKVLKEEDDRINANRDIWYGNGKNLAFKTENDKSTVKTHLKPPEGLKGIDLIIWKAENQK